MLYLAKALALKFCKGSQPCQTKAAPSLLFAFCLDLLFGKPVLRVVLQQCLSKCLQLRVTPKK